MYSVGENSGVCHKKQTSIVYPVFFGEKTWAQIAGGFSSHGVLLVLSSAGSFLGVKLFLMASNSLGDSCLTDRLASLEYFLELLSDQVSVILKKLSFVELVPMLSISCVSPLVVAVPLNLALNSDMAVDNVMVSSSISSLVVKNIAPEFSLSSLKVFTTKMDGLELKIMVLDILFISSPSILMNNLVWKFATCNIHGINVSTKQNDVVYWHVSSGCMVSFMMEIKLWSSGFFGAKMAVIINNSLAHHVSKVEEDKLLVTILELYTGVFPKTRFSQALAVNSLIAKAVNSSTFVVLGGDFNENGSGRSASFKFCSDLSLVNSFAGHCLVKASTWYNFQGSEKTIDYIFVSKTLLSAVTGHQVCFVSSFFNTDYNAVLVLVGLSGLLDVCLNSLHKQTNKDCWKFKIKNADDAKWLKFKEYFFVKLSVIKTMFSDAKI
ncbi:hypothetical protein G9A89_022599 [Geosiphon pyriformis]|nr:hypothetical protein G9A89_022599 [Geosiphon pyriformis]